MEVPQGYKQTSIGIIPEDWEVKELKDFLEFKNGINSEKDNYGSGFKFINVMEVIYNNIITDNLIKGSVLISESEKELYKVNIGDLLFNRTSETPSEIGLTSVYAGNDKNVVFGGFVIRGIFKDDSVAFDFKKVGFRSNIVRKQIIKYGQGAVRANIGQKDLEKVKIPVPPLPEQQKIAEILSNWDKAIELCQKIIEELKQRNKGLAQQLLSGKKRVKGFEETIWKTVKMRNIGKIPKKEAITDIGNHRTLTVRLYAKGVDFNNSVKTVISTSGRPYYVRYKDEILIGRQNIHNGGIGIVNEKQSGNICSNAISSFVVNENNDLKFIFIKLSTPFVYKRIENFMGGTGQKELSENEWLKLEIKIPEKSEQKAISKILDTASSELKHYEEKLTNLKLQKKGLMQQLLTGKVRVRI